MADYQCATLGAFAFDGASASIVSDIVVGAVPHTTILSGNCLAAAPVEVVSYVSGFGTIAFTAKLAGRDTVGESAAEHLARMWANLVTEVEKDSNTFSVYVAGLVLPYAYAIKRNDDFDKIITPLTQSRSVMKFAVALKYL